MGGGVAAWHFFPPPFFSVGSSGLCGLPSAVVQRLRGGAQCCLTRRCASRELRLCCLPLLTTHGGLVRANAAASAWLACTGCTRGLPRRRPVRARDARGVSRAFFPSPRSRPHRRIATRIIVQNLSFGTTHDDLAAFFRTFVGSDAEVTDVLVAADPSGRSKGFGFVTFGAAAQREWEPGEKTVLTLKQPPTPLCKRRSTTRRWSWTAARCACKLPTSARTMPRRSEDRARHARSRPADPSCTAVICRGSCRPVSAAARGGIATTPPCFPALLTRNLFSRAQGAFLCLRHRGGCVPG